MSVAVLCGGVGAARFCAGLAALDPAPATTAIVNVGDDLELHGLRICPDLDTMTYTLAGLNDQVRGWGLRDESFSAMDQLERYGGATWFRLGDRDLAIHLYRTGRLVEGAGIGEVTRELAKRLGISITLVPVSEDRLRTRLELASGEVVDFQEYFVRRGHAVAVRRVRFEGASEARPAPGVLVALEDAQRLIIAPSNPIVSIQPVLAVSAVADVVAKRRDQVVAISPIVGGKALKGPADRLLVELGYEASPLGVARALARYLGTLIIDEVDAHLAPAIEAEGLRCVVTDTVMRDRAAAAALAAVALRTPLEG